MLMADDKTTKMPEQPITDTGLAREPARSGENAYSPGDRKKTEQRAKDPAGVRL